MLVHVERSVHDFLLFFFGEGALSKSTQMDVKLAGSFDQDTKFAQKRLKQIVQRGPKRTTLCLTTEFVLVSFLRD